MTRSFLLLAFLLLSVGSRLFSMNDGSVPPFPNIHPDSVHVSPLDRSSIADSWSDVFTHLPHNWSEWYRREFRTERLPFYAGIAGGTAVLMATDRATYVPFRDIYNRSHAFKNFSDRSEFMGQGWFQFGIAGAFALEGWAEGDQRAMNTAVQTTEVILSCGGVIQLLKHVTGRETPILSSTPTGIWRFFPNQIDYAKHVPKYDSFPTGHLATATAVLTVIEANYPEKHWVPYVGIPAIACIGVGMVGQGIHWWSDYPLGIAIGYSFGKIVGEHHHSDTSEAVSSIDGPDCSFTLIDARVPALSFQWHL